MYEPVLPANVPQPLDQELLAWAAGFFDGEGSTIAKCDSRRHGYYQLDVGVPQSGPAGVPEVLIKFQKAMLGVGKIYPQHRDDMYRWSACGRVASELTLALMWPWLGDVKRAQASAAAELVNKQYADARYRLGKARNRPTLIAHERRTSDRVRIESAWAAGFLDGEGYFGLPRSYQRADGSEGFVLRASASQHSTIAGPPTVLTRLLATLRVGRIEPHGELDDYKWVTEGTTNVGAVLEEVREWLGPVKTLQAESALETALMNRQRGDSERCKRGHMYDRIAVRPNGTIHRICNSCDRMNDAVKRAAAGSKPRILKKIAVDPTRIYAS